MRDMHVYSQEEYAKKQSNFITENIMKPFTEPFLRPKVPVIKNYVYYAQPVRID